MEARTSIDRPRDWNEGRRLRAWELKQQGWKQRAIAAALGVTEGAVSQWIKRARQGGPEALRRRTAPGGRPKYHPAHVSKLLRACGWSLQKPRRQASQRSQAAVET